jgi:hypothetical protein
LATVLTKSHFLSGLQCAKRLWYETQAVTVPLTPDQRHSLEQGQAVGRFAQQQFPDGQLIGDVGEAALQATAQAIAAGTTCLFEAAFCWQGWLVRCDILQRQPDGSWTLIEVKASTKVKDEHLWDAAVQCAILTGAGVAVGQAHLMHINRKTCVYPDLSTLFQRQDITAEVFALQPQVSDRLSQFQTLATTPTAPEVAIGDHCRSPYPCPFKAQCWQGVPAASIFTIPRLDRRKKQRLIEQNCWAIADLPADLKLSPKQQAYVETVRRGEPQIDHPKIAELLSTLTFPIHFFDFETFNPAIPRFAGLKPYDQFPFQYSCHVLAADGTLSHGEYLHGDGEDPRPSLLASLLTHIGPTGSVMVYHQSFEAGVLQTLADTFPAHGPVLTSIRDRLWDLEVVFKDAYRHPDCLGSTSIKKVLPVVVPSLSYDQLAVSNGAIAQAVWDTLVQSTDPAEQQQLSTDLKTYCTQDTLAMVEIYRALQTLVNPT